MLSRFWSDLRFSVRVLARNPVFAAAAIVTVALGIGVNTGIFTVLNGILFRELPVPDAHELVSITQTIRIETEAETFVSNRRFSSSEYRAFRDRAETLSGIIGYSDPTRTTLGGETPEQLMGTIVTCEYFDVLRQPVALGRGLTAQDCETGGEAVVVLAHELWTTRFGGDPEIAGSTVELNRQLFTVVGVAAEGTYSGFGLYGTDYFAPISTEPQLLPNENSYPNDQAGWLFLIGRREAGLEQVGAELGLIAAQIDQLEPSRSTTVHVERATPTSQIGFLRAIALTVGSVVMVPFGLVLLIACANVANLLLAHAASRVQEIAVRVSLGASRGRVIRQLLMESVLISACGGVLGALIALWTFPRLIASVLPSFSPPGVPPMLVDASPDIRVLAFTLALTFLTGILFGLAPTLQVSKPDLHTVIKQDTRGAGTRRGSRLQGTLVGVQVAVSMVLMISTALLLRGLAATQTINPGFDYENVAFASIDLVSAGYDSDEAAAFHRRLLEEVGALVGVESAAYAVVEPLRPDTESGAVRLPGEDQFRLVSFNAVTPGYFDLLGLPIVQGRTFVGPVLGDASGEVIVTESTAANLWPGEDPIGQTLSMATFPDGEVPLTVVGVSRDAQLTSVGQIEPFYLYTAAGPRVAHLLQLLVRSRTDFASTAASIENQVRALDTGVVVEVNPLETNLDYWRNLSGIVTGLAGALGLLALVLASVGIYGVVSYFVGRRTREIGIRMALGAGRRSVFALVMKRTMRPVFVGALIGIAAASAVSDILSSVLFGVSPLDPIGIAGAAICVLGIALAAGFLPGRRATRGDPAAALHYE